jgi:hypothetical protein
MDARTSQQVIPEVWPRKAADLWPLEKNGLLTSRRVRSSRCLECVGIGGDCLKEEAAGRRIRAGVKIRAA